MSPTVPPSSTMGSPASRPAGVFCPVVYWLVQLLIAAPQWTEQIPTWLQSTEEEEELRPEVLRSCTLEPMWPGKSSHGQESVLHQNTRIWQHLSAMIAHWRVVHITRDVPNSSPATGLSRVCMQIRL